MDINPVSGQILIGDVGGDLFEESMSFRPGVIMVGRGEGPRTNQDAPSNYVDPIYAYNHDSGCAVAGLAIYIHPRFGFLSTTGTCVFCRLLRRNDQDV